MNTFFPCTSTASQSVGNAVAFRNGINQDRKPPHYEIKDHRVAFLHGRLVMGRWKDGIFGSKPVTLRFFITI